MILGEEKQCGVAFSRLKAAICCMTCTYHCEASVVNTSAYSLLLKMCIRDGSSDRCDSKRSSIDWKSMAKQQRDFITKLGHRLLS